MKQIFSFIFLFLLFASFFLFPEDIQAAAEGESCCQGGYSYNSTGGTCLNNQIADIVDSYAAPATCHALFPFNLSPDFSQTCTDTVSSAYKNLLASRPQLEAGGATAFCSTLYLGIASSPATIDQAIDACSAVFIVVNQRINSIARSEVPTSCNAGLQCNTSGTCDSRAAGGALVPYDPSCTPGDTSGVKTALGCLPTDPFTFVNLILPWATLVGAGMAFLLGLYGALMIVISAGDPEKMQAGKELITSAIGGLLLIIFAIFILKVVGVNILGLFVGAR